MGRFKALFLFGEGEFLGGLYIKLDHRVRTSLCFDLVPTGFPSLRHFTQLEKDLLQLLTLI
jgi:hypothetical protein